MSKINVGRMVLGGIVAGIVINIVEYLLNGIYLADQWTSLMQSINRPEIGMNEIVMFNVIGFVLGFAAIWTYAAIRPRFGAGVRTAVYAALLTWVTGYVLADWSLSVMGLFSNELMLTLVIVGLAEIILATIAGAYFYKEA